MITHVLDSMNEVITNNYDANHKAIDIVASDNSEPDIIALKSGTVKTVVNNIKGTNHKSKGLDTYGNYVKIKQTDGNTALYAHMKHGSITVKEGEYVEKGETIGTIGETGNAYGKHLHLEIQNENNIKENPLISLNENSNDSNKLVNVQKTEEKTTSNSSDSTLNNNHTNPTTNNLSINQVSHNYKSNEFLSAKKYTHGSIVDALKSINMDSSYNYRKKLAKANGIENYHGSYSQNVKMLKLLKQGNLKKV